MYQEFFDQAETLLKPLNDLVATNQAALGVLTSKQVGVVGEMLQGTIVYVQKMAEIKDGNYLEVQKAYWDSLNETINEVAKSSLDYFSVTQEKLTGLFQNSLAGAAFAKSEAVTSPVASPAEAPLATSPRASVAAEPLIREMVPAETKVKAPEKTVSPKVGEVGVARRKMGKKEKQKAVNEG